MSKRTMSAWLVAADNRTYEEAEVELNERGRPPAEVITHHVPVSTVVMADTEPWSGEQKRWFFERTMRQKDGLGNKAVAIYRRDPRR